MKKIILIILLCVVLFSCGEDKYLGKIIKISNYDSWAGKRVLLILDNSIEVSYYPTERIEVGYYVYRNSYTLSISVIKEQHK